MISMLWIILKMLIAMTVTDDDSHIKPKKYMTVPHA